MSHERFVFAGTLKDYKAEQVDGVHFHLACDEMLLTRFGLKVSGFEPTVRDVYFDREDGLHKKGFWLRCRFSTAGMRQTWALIETVSESDLIHCFIFSDEEYILAKLREIFGWNGNSLDEIPHFLTPMVRFSSVRHSVPTAWGAIAIEEVRYVNSYFWIATASVTKEVALELAIEDCKGLVPCGSKVVSCLHLKQNLETSLTIRNKHFHPQLMIKSRIRDKDL